MENTLISQQVKVERSNPIAVKFMGTTLGPAKGTCRVCPFQRQTGESKNKSSSDRLLTGEQRCSPANAWGGNTPLLDLGLVQRRSGVDWPAKSPNSSDSYSGLPKKVIIVIQVRENFMFTSHVFQGNRIHGHGLRPLWPRLT